ncbi:MAG: helix-turn-helix transcriptional regulator [Gemmatimonadales bacterium]
MGKRISGPDRKLAAKVQRAFGEKLRQARSQGERKIIQDQLAQSLGVTRASVSNIENGRHRIFLDQVFAAARALGVPASSLLPTDSELFSEPTVHAAVSAGFGSEDLKNLSEVARAIASKTDEELRRLETSGELANASKE